MKARVLPALVIARTISFLTLDGPAAAQVTSRASIDSAGIQGSNSSVYPSISGDDRYVTLLTICP